MTDFKLTPEERPLLIVRKGQIWRNKTSMTRIVISKVLKYDVIYVHVNEYNNSGGKKISKELLKNDFTFEYGFDTA